MTDELMGACLADKYLIEEHLGSGGMCDVYRARHVGMDKPVAVKVLKSQLASDPKIAKRFEQEARAASRIHHPHAINVTDYGIDSDKTPFIVMELVKGETLGQTLRSTGAFSVERAANILRKVCGALEAAHTVGVIHRDIKPENIILAEYEGSDWVEVVDFGVAKILEDVNRRGALTGANIIVGTPRYMSPEQCEEKPVDARSDIYSVGVVLYGSGGLDARRVFLGLVVELCLETAGAVHHMRVGQHKTLLGVDHDTGAGGHRVAPLAKELHRSRPDLADELFRVELLRTLGLVFTATAGTQERQGRQCSSGHDDSSKLHSCESSLGSLGGTQHSAGINHGASGSTSRAGQGNRAFPYEL